jgi:hypothetical protein
MDRSLAFIFYYCQCSLNYPPSCGEVTDYDPSCSLLGEIGRHISQGKPTRARRWKPPFPGSISGLGFVTNSG